MPSPYNALRALLSDRPIAFHPMMARVLGGINEALFFQQIAYWSDKGSDPDWIYKSQVELESETTLSEYQQVQARKKLKALGVLQDERRGVPARLYYRVNWDALFQLLESRSEETGNLDSEPVRFRETANLDSDELVGMIPGNSEPLTESTQRQRQRDRSKDPEPVQMISSHERRMIEAYINDYARELNDRAPMTSTVTRTIKLYANSGLSIDAFLDLLIEAKGTTQRSSGSIRSDFSDGTGRKAKIGYWFAVVEDLIEQRGA